MKKSTKKEKKSPGKVSVVLRVFLTLVVVMVVGAFGYAYYTYKELAQAVNPDTLVNVVLVIEPEDTLSTVADYLKEIRLINNIEVFKLAARISNRTTFVTGYFMISAAMDCDEILAKITDPTQATTDQVAVNMSAGYGAKEIAAAIAEKCDVSVEAMYNIWRDEDYLENLSEKYWFISRDLNQEGVRFFLEGYLYPETTLFYKTAQPEAITNRILNNFDEKIEPLKSKIQSSSLSINEIITLASLVQYEAVNVEDMPRIAGVYMKRLDTDMPLQSEATICYVLSSSSGRDECKLKKNQAIESPYNTFKNTGLPIGPVLSPTLKAIEAVLDYEVGDYIYFMYDGEGNIHLARSYATQLANQEKYGN